MLQLYGPFHTFELGFSADGRYLAALGSYANLPCVWNSITGEVIYLPERAYLPNRVVAAAFDHDQPRIWLWDYPWNMTNERPLRLSWYDLGSGTEWQDFSAGMIGREGSVWVESLVDQRLLIALGNRLELVQWADRLHILRTWDRLPTTRNRALSRDANWVVFAFGRNLVCHDLPNDRSYHFQVPKLTSPVMSLAISPDNRMLACAIAHHVHLFELPQGKWLAKLHGRTRHQVNDIAFSPDGQTLATVEGQGFARLWDLPSQTERMLYQWPIGPGNCVAFAPDGLRLAVAGVNGRIIICDQE